jgi:hypothetical protein
MGRKRKDGDPLGLAGTRLVFQRGRFFYIHRDTGKWENVGTDVEAAKRTAARYNNPGDGFGTMAYWFQEFLADCKLRVKATTLSQRTLDDYTGYAAEGGPLVAAFGRRFPDAITPAISTGRALRLHRARRARRARGRPVPVLLLAVLNPRRPVDGDLPGRTAVLILALVVHEVLLVEEPVGQVVRGHRFGDNRSDPHPLTLEDLVAFVVAAIC